MPGSVPGTEWRWPVKITLVPSAVTEGQDTRGFFLSSYLVNDSIAIDAGGLGFLGDVGVQARVRHVFLTHAHMDHIASLPVFLETVFQSGDHTVTLHAEATTLEILRRDVFNDRVWPDFIGMSEKGLPFVRTSIVEPHRAVDVDGLRLLPVPVDHVIPTLGFLISRPGATVAIPSDTGPTEEFWREAARAPDLKAVFLEASFPDAMEGLARISKHLTPSMFATEARKLPSSVPFYAVHIKPRFAARVIAELTGLGMPNIRIGRPGEAYDF